MIVCSCNVLSDADVRNCLNRLDAPRNALEVYGSLGCAPKCGVCADTIRNIMEIEQRLAAEAQLFCSRRAESKPEIT
jgi:bacterioferritin-associated ferredoxin